MSVFNEPAARVCRVCKAEKPYKAFWIESKGPKRRYKSATGKRYGTRGYLAKSCVSCREKDKQRKRVAAKANPRPKRSVPTRVMTPEEYEAAFGKAMPRELAQSI